MTSVIAVVGMHRSGTSALTGALVKAGAWFGDPALAAGGRPARPLGLVERKDFLALTEPALRTIGCSWHDVHGFQPVWEKGYAEKVREQFRTGVLADLLEHNVSVLKDPRLCLLLPLFLPAIPCAVGVLIVRSPLEVALSLAQRNGFPIPLGVALWEAYNRQGLLSLQDLPSVLVLHRDLIRRPEECIPDLIGRLSKLGVGELDAKTALENRSIDRNLHHHRAGQAEGHELSSAQRRLWRELRQATTPGEVAIAEMSPESTAVLREHRAEIARAPAQPGSRRGW